MPLFRRREQRPGEPPPDSPTVANVTPQQELEAFGPVLRHNHIAYVPAKEFSGVPGVGAGNLAYLPDFLLSPPAWIAGAATLRRANSITIANRPAVIKRPKQTLEGVGGLVAGQIVHQPLLSIDVDANNSGVGE